MAQQNYFSDNLVNIRERLKNHIDDPNHSHPASDTATTANVQSTNNTKSTTESYNRSGSARSRIDEAVRAAGDLEVRLHKSISDLQSASDRHKREAALLDEFSATLHERLQRLNATALPDNPEEISEAGKYFQNIENQRLDFLRELPSLTDALNADSSKINVNLVDNNNNSNAQAAISSSTKLTFWDSNLVIATAIIIAGIIMSLSYILALRA